MIGKVCLGLLSFGAMFIYLVPFAMIFDALFPKHQVFHFRNHVLEEIEIGNGGFGLLSFGAMLIYLVSFAMIFDAPFPQRQLSIVYCI